MTTQPEAMRLADELLANHGPTDLDERVAAELLRLHAENEQLRADAERYRWLREHGDNRCTEKDGYGGQTLRLGERLDAAVDAAMKVST